MPEYDEQGNPVEVIAAIQDGARENYNALMEAAVQRATDAVCDFDPDAAAYRARTEAWVRLALTVALAPPDGGHSSTPEPAAAGGAERSQSPEQASAVAAVREAAGQPDWREVVAWLRADPVEVVRVRLADLIEGRFGEAVGERKERADA